MTATLDLATTAVRKESEDGFSHELGSLERDNVDELIVTFRFHEIVFL